MERQNDLMKFFRENREKRKKTWNLAQFYFKKVIREEGIREKSGYCGNSRENSSSRGRNLKLEPISRSARTDGVLKMNNSSLA
jgi:hypothetical protein